MSKGDFVCPKCQGTETAEMGPYHAVMVHWLLNPGLAFNEILLGQAVGRDVISCASCSPGVMNNVGKYLLCPSCGRAHKTDLWLRRNAFGHWRGLICPDCAATIPRAWNATSLLILSLTFLLWWPLLKLFGDQWREKLQKKNQKARERLEAKNPDWPITLPLGQEDLSGKVDVQVPVKLAPVAGLGRCPYCHDEVEKAAGVACTDCLARHHEECWDEHRECASCGGVSRYGSVERSDGRERGSGPIREKG